MPEPDGKPVEFYNVWLPDSIIDLSTVAERDRSYVDGFFNKLWHSTVVLRDSPAGQGLWSTTEKQHYPPFLPLPRMTAPISFSIPDDCEEHLVAPNCWLNYRDTETALWAANSSTSWLSDL